MKIMSIDLGDARTGLAICDKGEMLATPLTVITCYTKEKLADEIVTHVKENRIERIILGHPINMNGTLGARSEIIHEFKELLSKKTDVEVILWDERATTVSATAILNETNTRGKKRKAVIDAVAATIILESYLNYRRNNKED